MKKKMIIFAASLIYLNYIVDYSLKTKKYIKKLKDLPYRIFTKPFVLRVLDVA